MERTATRVLIASLLGALTGCAEPKCGGSDVKYYDQAIGYHLAQRGVPYSIRSGGMVCVEGKHAADFVAAERQAEKYFHEVADLLKDACEEQALVVWATREKLRFDVRGTIRSDGSPGGRMFLLRSFTMEEVAENMRRLSNDAPRGASCPKEGPIVTPDLASVSGGPPSQE
jgi:hypothetical protein